MPSSRITAFSFQLSRLSVEKAEIILSVSSSSLMESSFSGCTAKAFETTVSVTIVLSKLTCACTGRLNTTPRSSAGKSLNLISLSFLSVFQGLTGNRPYYQAER